MSTVSELYMRAVGYALKQGFTAKDATCEWNLGGYRWFFNGKKEPVDSIPFGHLAVFNRGDFPVILCGPRGGAVVGDLEAEVKLIAILKAENSVELP